MAWCPKCKNEYQEGITVCADCGAELVDELPVEIETAPVAYISEEELALKLVDYLKYSSIEGEISYDEAQQAFAVLVPKDKLLSAKTAFRAFYNVETSKQALTYVEAGKIFNSFNFPGADKFTDSESDSDIDFEVLNSISDEDMSEEEKGKLAQAVIAEQVYRPSEIYVKKSDESKDMFSTAITFLAFAFLLLVFLILNALKIITMFSNAASLIMMGILSIGCCMVGINAVKRSRSAEVASVEEEKLTDSLSNWLNCNISDADFETLDEENMSAEVLFLRRSEIIHNKMIAAFPDLDDNYVDALVEDFYDKHFEEETM